MAQGRSLLLGISARRGTCSFLVTKVAFDDFVNVVNGEIEVLDVSVLVNVHDDVVTILTDAVGKLAFY